MKEKVLNKKVQYLLSNQYLLLIPIVLIYFVRSLRYLRTPFYSPDAEHVYLPFAKKLLEVGPAFFFEKTSLATSPGTYLWPALFHANSNAIRIASMILGIFILLFIYKTGEELYSKTAGLIASFFFAISPTLIVWIPTILTEPTYIFFSIVFIWSLIKMAKGNRLMLPITSFSLMVSIFIRPVWLYPAILFLVLFFSLGFIVKEQRKIFTSLSLSILLGLALPMAFIIRNQIKYDLPNIAVGSGAVLFYGTNPFTGGFEPPIMNLSYGIGSQNRPELYEPQNLLIRNKKLMDVAKAQLKNMTLKEFSTFVAKKISWFMFFTPIESSPKSALLRAFEVALGVFAFSWGMRRKNYLIVSFAIIILVQLGQAILALYNIRYSAGNLEPLIITLGAIGGAILIEKFQENFKIFFTGLFLCFILTVIGIFLHFNVLPKTYYPSSIPFYTLFEKNTGGGVKAHSLDVNIDKLSPKVPENAFVKVDFLSRSGVRNCKNNFIYFKGNFSKRRIEKQIVNFDDINDKLEIYIGALTPALEEVFKENGTLSIESDCLTNEKISISKISIIEANVDKFWN